MSFHHPSPPFDPPDAPQATSVKPLLWGPNLVFPHSPARPLGPLAGHAKKPTAGARLLSLSVASCACQQAEVLLALCRSMKPLIATCVRYARDVLSLDLEPCTKWLRCVEVHYQRPPSSSAPDATETSEAMPFLRGDTGVCSSSANDSLLGYGVLQGNTKQLYYPKPQQW